MTRRDLANSAMAGWQWLLSGGERGGEILRVDGEGGLHAAATHHHGL